MQELGEFNLKKNVIPNGLDLIIFIDSYQFLSSSLNSLVKDLNKDDFKYLSQVFDNKVLDQVKQKEFYPHHGYMSYFEQLKEELPRKEKFHRSLTNRKITGK